MRQILIIGAGKSTSVLIEYLCKQGEIHDWNVRVGDLDLDLARSRVKNLPRGEAIVFDADDTVGRDTEIQNADLVVSMLPPPLHPPVAEACIHYRTHFVSASYVSQEVKELNDAAVRAGIIILSEVGVDPGIDHMSAMEKLDQLRRDDAKITEFETFTGGLVAPDSDDNPWGYKFTWNPRNVVIAGKGGVQFKHNGRYKYIPYHKLFSRFEILEVPGYGKFEGYPNRDSLKYRHHYGLYDVNTIYRGTLRRLGFCQAWDCLVQLGLTDDSYEIEGLESMTYRDFVNSYLWYDRDISVELKIKAYLKLELNSPAFDRLESLGLFEKKPIGLRKASPAAILGKLLEEKWRMKPTDKDMIVMLHKYAYQLNGEEWESQSSMVTLGEDSVKTAMAKTVGLAAGISSKLVMTGRIEMTGVVIPTVPQVYAPVLAELRNLGISFSEETKRREISQHGI